MSLSLERTIMAWLFFFFLSWLALKAKSFLEDDEPYSEVICMYIS
jgi:hypothetical protein